MGLLGTDDWHCVVELVVLLRFGLRIFTVHHALVSYSAVCSSQTCLDVLDSFQASRCVARKHLEQDQNALIHDACKLVPSTSLETCCFLHALSPHFEQLLVLLCHLRSRSARRWWWWWWLPLPAPSTP